MAVRVFSEHRKGRGRIRTAERAVRSVLRRENREADITVIFVGDETMLRLNEEYLQHRHQTDVITFPLEDRPGDLEAEIYVNVEQAERQAGEFSADPDDEVNRLVIHGVLHTVGFKDTTTRQRRAMSRKEDEYLKLLTAGRSRGSKG